MGDLCKLYHHFFIDLTSNYQADQVEKPLEVFSFLYKNKIGGKLALFYTAWALLEERRGEIATAEKIFSKGLQKYVKNEPTRV